MPKFRRQHAPSVDLAAITEAVTASVKAALPVLAPAGRPGADQFSTGSFGPGFPLLPAPLGDPREPANLSTPRRSEFQVGANLQTVAPLPFDVLRKAADQIDVLRRLIQVRKSQMLALDFDVVLTRQATRRVMRDNKISNIGEAAQLARAQFEPDMIRLREWWETPDSLNALDFPAWLGSLLEDQLVVDAATIWPRRRGSGEVVALEVIDGTTIKPLLDGRGSTPLPPAPAYQQILYGFPRGEFTVDDPSQPGFRTDQIVYRPRHRRSFSPYGMPETEFALLTADIYMKRMSWIRGEFTDGRTPDTWIRMPESSQMTPAQMREWEAAMNAELVNPQARRELRMLPPGAVPEAMKNFAELYRPELDETLMKLMCMCYGVLPTEMGYPPSSGIGGKGHQEGESNSAWKKTIKPYARWVEGTLTLLSRQFLGMPEELELKLLGYEVEDQTEAENVANSQIRRGAITLNDDRAARGEALYTFREADTPFIITPSGLVFLDGAIAAQAAALSPPDAMPAAPPVEPVAEAETAPVAEASDPRPDDPAPSDGDPISDSEPIPAGFHRVAGHIRRNPGPTGKAAAIAELDAFLTYTARRRSRPFVFQSVPQAKGAELLALAGADGVTREQLHGAVRLAKSQMRTRRPGRVHPQTRAQLVATHAHAIGKAAAKLIGDPEKLAGRWEANKAPTPTSEIRKAARAFVASAIGLAADLDLDTLDIDEADLDGVDVGDLADEVDAMYEGGYSAAFAAVGVDPDPDNPGPRRSLLNDARDVMVAGLVGTFVGLVADALTTGSVADAVTDPSWAVAPVSADITTSFSAGTLDGCAAADIERVRLVASAGDCEFCDGYDGRIMSVDDEGGMPPLHRGCSCDLEPLT